MNATQNMLLPVPSDAAKHCPLCWESRLSEFGICRARKDGRNLYCKSCIRRKVTAARRELKAYRAARKQRQLPLLEGGTESAAQPERVLDAQSRTLSAVERVKLAITRGARTQRAIAMATRLGKDEIGDALAELLLWTREVKTELINNVRSYTLSTDKAPIIEVVPPLAEPGTIPARKPDVRAGFAAIPQLMPARITGERKAG